MRRFEKVCLVLKESPLQGLLRRYGSLGQVQFILMQQGIATTEYERFDRVQNSVFETLRSQLSKNFKVAVVDFQFLPTYQFDPAAVVVTIGPDGLVANTAKYLDRQPIIAVNPDPKTIDGVLASQTVVSTLNILAGQFPAEEQSLTMAEAVLPDGQRLFAVNDLFIGQRTHVSARYRISHAELNEQQSSSGIIVSTGTGSTGWYRSMMTGARRIIGDESNADTRFSRTTPELRFTVREPFVSRASLAGIVHGTIRQGESLNILSEMPQNGVIFSDGVESDFLEFNSGVLASIRVSDRTVSLIV